MRNLILTLLAISIFTSCAFKQLAAKNLDNFLYLKITSTLDLYARQKDELSKDLSNFLNQQKVLVDEMKTFVAQVDLQNVQKIPGDVTKIVAYYDQISHGITPIIAKYISVLDEKQQVELFKNLTSQNAEQEEKLGKTDKTNIGRMEFFFGSMTPAQNDLLVKYQATFKEHALRRFKEKLALQDKMKLNLKTGTPEQKQTLLTNDFYYYQKVVLLDPATLSKFLQELAPTLEKKQIAHFTEKKQDLIELLDYFDQTKY